MSEVARPVLRWHGGKWLLAPWIISHFPPHKVYIEPFGGGGSVLLRKSRAYAEVYNDLDGEAVNLFRIMRDPAQAARLIGLLRMTPFARVEFDMAHAETDCAIERARRLIIRSFMGFGSDGFNKANRTGFRANSNRSGTTPAHDWANYPEALAAVVDRLTGVIIEQRDARAVMAQHDCSDSLHYVDPPYLPETRSQKSSHRVHAYVHEMDVADHIDLLDFLRGLKGAVVLSGYPSDLYDSRLPGWWRFERAALADGARKRTEVLWTNRPPSAGSLFGERA